MSANGRFALWQGLIIISGLFLTGISSWLIYQGEIRDVNNAMKIDVDHRSEVLARMLFSSVEPLHVMAALFENDTPPTYARFNKHAQRIFSDHNAIQALEWIPKVQLSERDGIEKKMRHLYPDFEIRQRGLDNSMVRASEREEYFPVSYVAPIIGNEKAIGFDLASNATRYASLIKSRDSATEIATASINLVQETGNSKGFLVFLPIYKTTFNKLIVDKNDFNEHLLGFVLGVYRINELFYKSALTENPIGLELMLYDNHSSADVDLLLRDISRTGVDLETDISYKKDLPLFYSRQWSLVAKPTHGYVGEFHSYIPHAVAFFGCLLTLLTVFYMRMIYSQSVRVQKMVDDKTRELSLVNQKLKRISRTDSLTQIANRRCMDVFFDKEWARAKRYQSTISVIMIDIDNFKQYNDFYGHQLGDECLKSVAQVFSKMLGRPGDMVARYGGEEFCLIIAHNTDVSAIAHKCQTSVERLQISHQMSQTSDYVTISVGYCTVIPQQGMMPQDALKAADKALYLAKDNGKNRVEKMLFESGKQAAATLIETND